MSVSQTSRAESIEVSGEASGLGRVVHAVLRFCRSKPLGASGAGILLFMVFCAVFAPVLAPVDPDEVDSSLRLLPPGPGFPLGTDNLGRDMLSRLLYGARVSVGIGFSTIVLSTAIAATIGLVSANWRGKLDLLLQRFVDGMLAIPTLILLLAAGFTLGRGAFTLIMLLGFVLGVRSSRVIRSAALSVMQNDYIVAARALGASDLRIILQHMLPNLFAPLMVLSTVQLGGVILTEASLSFLGLGVPPPAISWGQMLAGGRTGAASGDITWMLIAPWMTIVPGLTISAAVWGANMFGDALRDALDPRLRGRGN